MPLGQAATTCAAMQSRGIISGIQTLWFAVNDKKVSLGHNSSAVECFFVAPFASVLCLVGK